MEIIGAIAAVILQLVIELLNLVFASGYMATRTKGLSRAAYIGAFLSALYLLIAFLRGFVPALASPSLSAFFNWPIAAIVTVALLVLFTIPFAIETAKDRKFVRAQGRAKGKTEVDNATVPYVLTYVLSTAIVFGGLAVWSEGYRAPKMENRYCERLLAKFDPELTAQAKIGLKVLGKVLDRDFNKVSCLKSDDEDGE